MMKQGQFEGAWKKLKGSFRAMWADISSGQPEQVAVRKAQLFELIQHLYGMSPEKAELAIDNWYRRVDKPDKSEAVWNNLHGSWVELVGHVKEQFGQTVNDEFMESKGQQDIVTGLIQRQYNVSRGEAYEMINDWACRLAKHRS